MKVLSIIHGAGDWASCEKVIGEPISVVIDLGHVHHAGGVDVAEPLHGGDALLGRQPGPLALVEGGAGGGDGPVDVGRRALGHPADQLLGVGGDDLDDVGAGGVDPLAADEELLVDLHGFGCLLGQSVISPRATLPAHG